MDHNSSSVIELRQDFMVSPIVSSSPPSLRLARFLKPISSSPPPSPAPYINLAQDDSESLPAVHFKGWQTPLESYKTWVVSMCSKFKPTWEKAGILDAIMSSTQSIPNLDNLLLGLVKYWCPKTKSFVLDWGECTITLEDVYVLGGFSILGDSVLSPADCSQEMVEAAVALEKVRIELIRSPAKKAAQQKWMAHFMDVDNQQFEHEGFLAYWLSRFVFPHAFKTVGAHVFPLAVHLARGTRLALAPPVLASLYRDLGRVRDAKAWTVWAPFQLLQVWIWERVVSLRPELYTIRPVEPRVARWVVEKRSELEHLVDLVVDWNYSFVGEEFQWRPYASNVDNNVVFTKFYGSEEEPELEAFARCLRTCELVGVGGFREQYLPHGVAMQFGFDQDVPRKVSVSHDSDEAAWESYEREIDTVNLCIPSPTVTPEVTARYLQWRESVITSRGHAFLKSNKSKSEGAAKTNNKRRLKRLRTLENDDNELLSDRRAGLLDIANNVPVVPPGFSPKSNEVEAAENCHSVNPGCIHFLQPSTGIPSKCATVKTASPVDEDHIPIEKTLFANPPENEAASKPFNVVPDGAYEGPDVEVQKKKKPWIKNEKILQDIQKQAELLEKYIRGEDSDTELLNGSPDLIGYDIEDELARYCKDDDFP